MTHNPEQFEGWDGKQEIEFESNLDSNRVLFHYKSGEEAILVISKEGFFYRGEKVEDVNEIYKRFSEWMSGVEADALRKGREEVLKDIYEGVKRYEKGNDDYAGAWIYLYAKEHNIELK